MYERFVVQRAEPSILIPDDVKASEFDSESNQDSSDVGTTESSFVVTSTVPANVDDTTEHAVRGPSPEPSKNPPASFSGTLDFLGVIHPGQFDPVMNPTPAPVTIGSGRHPDDSIPTIGPSPNVASMMSLGSIGGMGTMGQTAPLDNGVSRPLDVNELIAMKLGELSLLSSQLSELFGRSRSQSASGSHPMGAVMERVDPYDAKKLSPDMQQAHHLSLLNAYSDSMRLHSPGGRASPSGGWGDHSPFYGVYRNFPFQYGRKGKYGSPKIDGRRVASPMVVRWLENTSDKKIDIKGLQWSRENLGMIVTYHNPMVDLLVHRNFSSRRYKGRHRCEKAAQEFVDMLQENKLPDDDVQFMANQVVLQQIGKREREKAEPNSETNQNPSSWATVSNSSQGIKCRESDSSLRLMDPEGDVAASGVTTSTTNPNSNAMSKPSSPSFNHVPVFQSGDVKVQYSRTSNSTKTTISPLASRVEGSRGDMPLPAPKLTSSPASNSYKTTIIGPSHSLTPKIKSIASVNDDASMADTPKNMVTSPGVLHPNATTVPLTIPSYSVEAPKSSHNISPAMSSTVISIPPNHRQFDAAANSKLDENQSHGPVAPLTENIASTIPVRRFETAPVSLPQEPTDISEDPTNHKDSSIDKSKTSLMRKENNQELIRL